MGYWHHSFIHFKRSSYLHKHMVQYTHTQRTEHAFIIPGNWLLLLLFLCCYQKIWSNIHTSSVRLCSILEFRPNKRNDRSYVYFMPWLMGSLTITSTCSEKNLHLLCVIDFWIQTLLLVRFICLIDTFCISFRY